MACQLLELKDCSNCYYFNGEEGDGTQFCDEKECFVHEESYCSRWKEKLYNDEYGDI